MQVKSCFLIGHRDTSEKILPALSNAVETHIINYGVTEFIVGHYGNFDRLAAKALLAAKQAHPEISLKLLLPYHSAEQPIQAPAGFDGTYYPFSIEKVPRKLAIVRANQYMVNHVDYLIAYAWQPASNAQKLLEYAKHQNFIKVFNIAEMITP